MKLDNTEDTLSYEKGTAIGEELLSLLKSGAEIKDIVELPHIKEWIETNPDAGELLRKLCSAEELTRMTDKYSSINPSLQVARFYNSIERKRIRKRVSRYVALVGSVAALAIFTFWMTISNDKFLEIPKNNSFAVEQEIEQPTLILNSGERVIVDEVSYDEKIELISQNTDKIQLNRLVVPPKCKFRLELEDGTIVLINADSEISYPISFRDDIRKIVLHRGEVFLEVAKSDKQFEVATANASVKVYGTKFNINHYTPDIIHTLLIEGSLGVALNNINETIIHPGELITLNSFTGDKEIKAVNTRKYLTWINGFVCCDEEPLELMLEQITRWYNIKFKIDKDVDLSIPINAYFSVERPINEIFKSIEDISNVKFIKTKGDEYLVEES
ncbi:MAG: FecR family protein [Bacteroidia bacterium]|nr:FecR family protein [Bacteroidia bacterium]